MNAADGATLNILLLAGGIMLAGLYLGKAVRRTRLPGIIGYMILGILIGPYGIDWLNSEALESLDFVVTLALSLVAFNIGNELSFKMFRKFGGSLISIILCETVLAFIAITVAVYLLTDQLALAILLAAIGAASAPAGTVAVIQDCRASGPMTRNLYAVVGFDDGLSVMIFGFALVLAKVILVIEAGNGIEIDPWWQLWNPIREVSFSVLLGGFFGKGYFWLIRRLRNRGDMVVLTGGSVVLLTGICEQFHLSYILANIVMGMVFANQHKEGLLQRVRDLVRNTMPLLYVLFFAVAGAHLDLNALLVIGGLGVAYCGGRILGKAGGATIGGLIGGADKKVTRWLGLGILSQAGLAIGLALIVQNEMTLLYQQYPEDVFLQTGNLVLTVITATTVFFEIIGPILTRLALSRAGEIPDEPT